MAETELELIVRGEDQASGVLGGVGNSLTAFGGDALRIGGILSIGLTAPLVAVGRSAVTMAADYQGAMNLLQTQTGATTGQMALLDALAIDLGADMSLPATSATDAAEAMYELSRRGIDVNNVLAGTRGVLELSAAGAISNAEAAQFAASALNAFGLAGSETTRVANLLAAASMASGASIQDLALGMQMSAAVFASAGQPIEVLTAALGEMNKAGIRGSDAGTSLKTMMLSLMSPTQGAAALMQSLGISVYDASGAMLPLPAIIGQFSTALGGLTQEQRNAALSTIFGSDAIRAANVVLMGGTQAFDGMTAAVTREGAAHDLAAARMAGFKGALAGLQSQVETTLLVATRPFLGVLENLVRRAADLVGGILTLNPQVLNAGIAFAVVLAAAGPVALAVGAVSMALGLLLTPVGLVVAATAVLAAAWAADFGGMQETTGVALTAIGGWLAGTMTVIQAEVPAAVARLVEQWRPAWETVQMTVESSLGAVQTIVATVIGTVTRSFSEHGAALELLFENAYYRIRDIVTDVLGAISTIVLVVLGNVQVFIGSHSTEIQTVLGNAWEAIGRIINLALMLIQATVVPAFNAIASFLSSHGTQIQGILDGVWQAIKAIITTVLAVIEGVLTAALALIRGDWSGAWEAIKDILEAVWEGIKGILNAALQIVMTLWGDSLTKMQTDVTTVWNQIKTFVTTTLDQIVEGVRGFVGSMTAAGSALIQGMMDGIRSMAEALVSAAVGVVQGAINAAKALLGISSPSTVFAEIGRETIRGYVRGIEETAPEAITATGDVFDEILKPIKTMLSMTSDLIAFEFIPDFQVRIEWLANAIGLAALELERVSHWWGGRLWAAAQTFAEQVKPVVEVFGAAVKTISGMGGELFVGDFAARAEWVANAIGLMMVRLADVIGWRGADVWAAVQDFAEIAQAVVTTFTSGLDAISKMAGIDLTGLNEASFAVGATWITSLADGIRSGMTYLEAALAAVAALFPHSPAREGPLRAQPDWAAWMLAGLGDAAGLVGRQLSSGMGIGSVGDRPERAGGQGSGGAGVTIHIHNPIVREEADLTRLAEQIGAVLAGKANLNRRMGYGWGSG